MIIEYYNKAVNKFSLEGLKYLVSLSKKGIDRYRDDQDKQKMFIDVYNVTAMCLKEELEVFDSFGVDTSDTKGFMDSLIRSIDGLSYKELLAVLFVFKGASNELLGENHIYDYLYERINERINLMREFALARYSKMPSSISMEECEILLDIKPKTSFTDNTLLDVTAKDVYHSLKRRI